MRLSTGIELLNRRLGGGLPPGSVVAFVTPPETQSELLLEELASERQTYFVSTVRPADEVEETMASADPADGFDATHAGPDELLDAPSRITGAVEERANLIVDPVDVLEGGNRSAYLGLLNEIKATAEETGSVAVLCGMATDTPPDHRALTLKRADVVWRLDMSVTSREITTTLLVPKFRGGSAVKEPIKLLLTDRVRIDTSRDI